MSSTVYLVRHTPAAIAANTCYGATDVPCDSAALTRALPWISGVLPGNALLVSSPLSRCAVLAGGLAHLEARRRLTFDAGLSERDCGSWEGMRWDDVPRAELDAWSGNFMDYAAPRAETVRQLQARVLHAWTLAQEAAGTRSLVLVSHAGPIQVILAHLELAQFASHVSTPVPQGAVVKAQRKSGKWQVIVQARKPD
jgi:alpha-ribazole phosphatase